MEKIIGTKMSTFGNIGEFRAEEVSFTSYKERVEAYFIANDIDNIEKQKSIFITAIGAKTYKLLRDLLIPIKSLKSTMKVIFETLEKYFEPKPCEIVKRFRFNTCERKETQTTGDYVAELRKLSEFCNYSNKLDEHIRDRLVCGIKDNRIQRRLLSEGDLNLQKALEICWAMEQAERNMVILERVPEPLPIHFMKNKEVKQKYNQNSNNQTKCMICGRTGHENSEFRFKNAKCFNCGKIGNLKNICRRSENKQTHAVSREDVESEEEQIYSMFNIRIESDGVITSTIRLNNVACKLQVDTGAAVSIISEKTWTKLGKGNKRPELKTSNIKLRTFTGELVPVLGKIEVDIDNNKRVRLYVVKRSVQNIAGRDLINKL